MLPAAQSALPLITSFILHNNVPAAVIVSCWDVAGNKSCSGGILALVMWIFISDRKVRVFIVPSPEQLSILYPHSSCHCQQSS